MRINLYSSIVLGRIVISGLIYGMGFFIASYAGAENYGEIALYIYLIKNIPLFTMGIAQGIIYDEHKSGGQAIKAYFAAYAVVCFLLLAFFGYFYSIFLVLVALPICLIHIAEPYLKTQKDFLAILYAELIATATFTFGFVAFGHDGSPYQSAFGLFVAAGLTSLFIFSRRKLYILFFKAVATARFTAKFLFTLVYRGGASYLFNLCWFAFVFGDRFIVETYYSPRELSSITLAFQLALVAGFVSVAINSRAVIDLRSAVEESKAIDIKELGKRVGFSVCANLFFVLVVWLAFWSVSRQFFADYSDVDRYFIPISTAIVLFNVYGSISPILFYLKRQIFPFSVLLLSCVQMFFNHHHSLVDKKSLLSVETVNYSYLSLGLIVCTLYVFWVASQRNKQIM